MYLKLNHQEMIFFHFMRICIENNITYYTIDLSQYRANRNHKKIENNKYIYLYTYIRVHFHNNKFLH